MWSMEIAGRRSKKEAERLFSSERAEFRGRGGVEISDEVEEGRVEV